MSKPIEKSKPAVSIGLANCVKSCFKAHGLAAIAAATSWACADAAYLASPRVCIRGASSCDVTEALARYRGVSVVAQGEDLLVMVDERPMLKPARCEVASDEWQQLETYAALTYVPETDASRLVGAGAGLTDND